MRIAIGGFQHESHSFAPLPTGFAQFLQPGGFPRLQRAATLIEALRPTHRWEWRDGRLVMRQSSMARVTRESVRQRLPG